MTLYTPLNHTKKEIRTLILQPLTTGTHIQCSTSTVSLLESPDFEALSYVWGDASIQQTITFNGVPKQVTQNLFTALTYLRNSDKSRTLWVDALCINQQDMKERNEQVAMMDEVYANAKSVLVWLGEADEESDEAFLLLSDNTTSEDIPEEISQKFFSFFMQLVEREWFTRLWTIQELVLATQDPLVGLGHAWTSWTTLVEVWKRVAMTEFTKMGMVMYPSSTNDENENKSKAEIEGVRTSAIKIDLLNNLRSESHGSNFRDLLLNTNSSNATEPRDIIYGLLGMLSPSARQDFTVDYARPLGAVFAEAVSHIFHHGRGAYLISGMQVKGPSPDPTYPSWVPKLGDKLLLKPLNFHPPGYGVSGSGADAINGTISPDLTTLRIRGLPIDTIIFILPFHSGETCLAQLLEVEALAAQARELAALHTISHPETRPYLAPFKTKEPLWRTLIANKSYSGAARDVAPDSYGEMYARLLGFHNSKTTESKADSELGGEDTSIRDYRRCLLNMLPGRCFFLTKTGFCGVAEREVEVGDLLAIWFGAPVPFVLRRVSGEGSEKDGEQVYNVCGVAYVAGIMDGEVVDEVYCEDLEDDVLFVVR